MDPPINPNPIIQIVIKKPASSRNILGSNNGVKRIIPAMRKSGNNNNRLRESLTSETKIGEKEGKI